MKVNEKYTVQRRNHLEGARRHVTSKNGYFIRKPELEDELEDGEQIVPEILSPEMRSSGHILGVLQSNLRILT